MNRSPVVPRGVVPPIASNLIVAPGASGMLVHEVDQLSHLLHHQEVLRLVEAAESAQSFHETFYSAATAEE